MDRQKTATKKAFANKGQNIETFTGAIWPQ
jgi:hypothetical protein